MLQGLSKEEFYRAKKKAVSSGKAAMGPLITLWNYQLTIQMYEIIFPSSFNHIFLHCKTGHFLGKEG